MARSDRLTHHQAVDFMESLSCFPVAALTTTVMFAAFKLCQRFTISYWDAAILEASRSLGCQLVLSEDLSHGQDYDGIQVQNPFYDV